MEYVKEQLRDLLGKEVLSHVGQAVDTIPLYSQLRAIRTLAHLAEDGLTDPAQVDRLIIKANITGLTTNQFNNLPQEEVLSLLDQFKRVKANDHIRASTMASVAVLVFEAKNFRDVWGDWKRAHELGSALKSAVFDFASVKQETKSKLDLADRLIDLTLNTKLDHTSLVNCVKIARYQCKKLKANTKKTKKFIDNHIKELDKAVQLLDGSRQSQSIRMCSNAVLTVVSLVQLGLALGSASPTLILLKLLATVGHATCAVVNYYASELIMVTSCRPLEGVLKEAKEFQDKNELVELDKLIDDTLNRAVVPKPKLPDQIEEIIKEMGIDVHEDSELAMHETEVTK